MRYRDAFEVPPDMTQEGLAAASWIELRHLSQYLRPLLAEELVRERTSHVKGIRQRRKVYNLTDAGQHAAHRLRDHARGETVRVRDAAGVHDEAVANVLERMGGKVSLLGLVRRSTQAGVVDLDTLTTAPPSAFVEELADAPRVGPFVGRQSELRLMTTLDSGPRVIVIRGVAGIGKSSVAAKACEMLRGQCNLFWHTLRPWDTPVSVLTALGDFLSAVGRPGLRAVVSRGEASRAAEVLREDLPGTRCFLVFDDAHDSSPEVLALFRFLKDAIADAPDARALLLTRRAIRFYDRRDVSIRNLVGEVDLSGLRREELAAFLEDAAEEGAAETALGVGGHPLFLQLVRSLPRTPTHETALRNMRRFLEEEVYAELAEPERLALKAASLYRVPVPPSALLATPAITHDTLLSLANRSLLRTVGVDRLEVHDTVRSFFAGLLTPSELSAMGSYALGQLRFFAGQARKEGNDVGSLDLLSNALALPASAEAREELLETLADVHEKIGDLPAALTEYKEAEKLVTAPEVRARLRRKTASAFDSRGEIAAAAKELESSRRALGDLESPERAWIDLVACRVALQNGEFAEARAAGRRALDGFQKHAVPEGRVRAQLALGNLELEDPQGDPLASERHYRDGIRVAQELRDVDREVRLRIGLAHLYADRLGDISKTTEEFRAIEATPNALRDPQTLRSFLMLQSWITLEIRADFPAAEKLFIETAALARKIHFVSSLPATRYGLALSEYYQGRLEEARRDLGAFARDSEDLGLYAWCVEALSVLAECSLRLGDVLEFHQAVERIGAPSLAAGRRAHPVRAALVGAVDLLLRGEPVAAHAAFNEALRLAGHAGETEQALELHFAHFYRGIALAVSGLSREAEDDLHRSRTYLERAHLNARLSILEATERELTKTLRDALDRPPA